MELVQMKKVAITCPTRAIICFGPATSVTGFRAGEYYQVLINPEMQSPSGEYIRFDPSKECEICGWQRIAGITICEILHSESDNQSKESVTMNVIDKD